MSAQLIENAATAVADRLRLQEAREDGEVTLAPKMKVHRPKIELNGDKELDRIIQMASTRIVEVDAKLQLEVPGRKGTFREAHYRNLDEMMAAKPIRRRIHEAVDAITLRDLRHRIEEKVAKSSTLREQNARLRGAKVPSAELRETGSFAMGVYDDERDPGRTTSNNIFNLEDTFLPSTTSPYSKQMLWFDYLSMHQKSWEAATRNPIAKRICDLIPMFVLGRGVIGAHKSADHQAAWDDFHTRNGMRARTRLILRELLIYGEVFLRYFNPRSQGLTLRSMDPSTIWDIITNPDDIEDIYYYHQQYTLINRSPVADVRAIYPSTLIIRQIPGREIDHFKINATSSEKRGRSQLYSVLAWLIRFKEFANDRVLLNKMRAMFALDVSVAGGETEISAVEEQFKEPPSAGAVFVHNDAAKIQFLNANNNANEAKTDSDMILQIIATGAGLSEQFLGGGAAATRASALIRTEPDIKTFETFQEVTEDILTAAWLRVQLAKNLPLNPKAGQMEFIFPALSAEDRSAKLKDIAFAEAMDYFSKERAAEMAAKEFMVSTYDYSKEQADIQKERTGKKFEQVIATGLQQVPKIMPAAPGVPGEDTQGGPGLGQDLLPQEVSGKAVGGNFGPAATAAKPEAGAGGTTGDAVGGSMQAHAAATVERGNLGSEMGFNAKRMSGRGQMNTRATLNRTKFTRGREKRQIRTNQTSGTPIRASGWSEQARFNSAVTRRLRRLSLLHESMERAKTEGNAPMEASFIEAFAELQRKLLESSERAAETIRRKIDEAIKAAPTRVVERDAEGRIIAIKPIAQRCLIERDETGRITAVIKEPVIEPEDSHDPE